MKGNNGPNHVQWAPRELLGQFMAITHNNKEVLQKRDAEIKTVKRLNEKLSERNGVLELQENAKGLVKNMLEALKERKARIEELETQNTALLKAMGEKNVKMKGMAMMVFVIFVALLFKYLPL